MVPGDAHVACIAAQRSGCFPHHGSRDVSPRTFHHTTPPTAFAAHATLRRTRRCSRRPTARTLFSTTHTLPIPTETHCHTPHTCQHHAQQQTNWFRTTATPQHCVERFVPILRRFYAFWIYVYSTNSGSGLRCTGTVPTPDVFTRIGLGCFGVWLQLGDLQLPDTRTPVITNRFLAVGRDCGSPHCGLPFSTCPVNDFL